MKVTITTDGENNKIKAGSQDNPTTTRLTIRVTQEKSDGFSKIDGLIYRAVAATSGNDETLNKNQVLQIKDLDLMLHGKVIYNLDD